ncbi:LOW QUALITY PROTEIN: serine/arginine repetitive matrix protein 1-like [Scylla paramamosain]|uniref:LOW QUALITY PROTEIN: serine/arginine repetitive matrix protein 1-like n=1 Tax=Scylla paramamosain TaxID=85552 RepID=UPI003082EC6A
MTDGDDLTKQVDQVYKNLLDKFNPAARNLITAGKAYLKALHGAMSASKIYLEALTKVARHSQQGTWGGSSDVGMCLMQMVDVYKEVQAQQMNILKAFYVDLLVPLETNLDKDTKVLQAEQKKFLATHKQKLDSYTKASSQLKKHKKKNRANKGAMDKEIKQYQAVEEERMKLEGFVESSLQNAVTQERRRYGFILERQCSLAKHYLAYHSRGASLLQHAHENWQEVAKTREALPDRLLAMLPSARPRDEGIYSTPLCLEEDAMSISSQVRKARSMDASCLDLSAAGERSRPADHCYGAAAGPWPSLRTLGGRAMARALYPYLPSGDNQLSFNEMDLIALIGEKNKGWQYGENLRSQRCGWFPVAYTELLHEEDDSALGGTGNAGNSAGVYSQKFRATSPPSAAHARASASSTTALPVPNESNTCAAPSSKPHVTPSPSLDTLHSSTSTSTTASSTNTVLYNHYHIHHPPHPPRVPAPTLKKSPSLHSHSHSSIPPHSTSSGLTRSYTTVASSSTSSTASSSHASTRFHKRGSGNASFHSSDDSGFSNESGVGSHRPPPNPEVDYSDDDNSSGTEQDHCRNTLSSRWLWSASSLNCDSMTGGTESREGTCFTPCTSTTYTSSSRSTDNVTLPSGKSKDRRRHPSLPSLASFSDHFVTVARRKTKPKSPCAQKILAQRERGRRTLRRSSSLLCLGMESCVGLDELLAADYEDMPSRDWKHTSKIDLLIGIPEPPPYDPPPPPTPPPNPSTSSQSTPSHTPRPPMPLPKAQDTPASSVHPKSSYSEVSQKSSSGNSTGSEEEEEVYMVVRDHRREMTKTITRAHTRKQVCRSLTWASPTPRSSSSPPAASRTHVRTSGSKERLPKDASTPQRHGNAARHQPTRAATVRLQNRPRQIERRVTYVDTPPPSLRKKAPRPPQPIPVSMPTQQSYNGHLNILNYSDFMNRRLKFPEGASRLDRHSLTTGQLCGPWYDLWGDDPSCDV